MDNSLTSDIVSQNFFFPQKHWTAKCLDWTFIVSEQ